jgi:hypothetical protein
VLRRLADAAIRHPDSTGPSVELFHVRNESSDNQGIDPGSERLTPSMYVQLSPAIVPLFSLAFTQHADPLLCPIEMTHKTLFPGNREVALCLRCLRQG